MFNWLKNAHEVFDLVFSGNVSELATQEPVRIETKKNKVVEPNDKMSEAQLNLVIELKSREIFEKHKGTPKGIIEGTAFDSLLDDTRLYQTKQQTKRVHTILDYVGSGKKVLDCAGGFGYIAGLLKQAGNDVIVLDHSEIQLLRAKWIRKLNTVLGSIDKLPFSDNAFDVVILANTLGPLKKISSVLAEAERVCKKDGQIIITAPISKSLSATVLTNEDQENDSIVISLRGQKNV
jgi:2-polyprenyl-3-methyl-5-hydroxy-6-metoxy-1,4-benzoquinol methylase